MCFGVDSKDLPRSLVALGELERMEGQELLVSGNDASDGSRGRVGRVHGVVLSDTRKPGDNPTTEWRKKQQS